MPEENSAVNQYTEAFPTAGGDRAAGGRDPDRSPASVLGKGNARRLESRGEVGRAAAEAAATTAPRTVDAEAADGATGSGGADAGTPGRESDAVAGAGGGGGASSGGLSNGAAGPPRGSGAPGDGSGTPSSPASADQAGASRLGQIVSQATGTTSSGELGLFLPLLILAALAWSAVYLLRQGKKPA